MAFPTLFSDGKGDPTNPSFVEMSLFKKKLTTLFNLQKIEMGSGFIDLHPRFAYWALNMIQRKGKSR